MLDRYRKKNSVEDSEKLCTYSLIHLEYCSRQNSVDVCPMGRGYA